MEARPLELQGLRQSNRCEESRLSGDRNVRPVRALLGLESEGLGRRLQRSDKTQQLAGHIIGIQAHDFRSFPEVDAVKLQFERGTVDLSGGFLQSRNVVFGKSADEYERKVPVIPGGIGSGELASVGLDRRLDFLPLFLRRPEGEEKPLLFCLFSHGGVREFPAGR